MTERERNTTRSEARRPEADPVDAAGERSRRDSAAAPKAGRRPSDQAIINQEQALESGEENVT